MLQHCLGVAHTPQQRYSRPRHQAQPSYCSRPGRKHLVTVCRYDRRRSANNYAERTQDGRKRPNKGLLDDEEHRAANDTIVAERARVLCAATQGQLAFQLCLFILTEQPVLLSMDPKQMAGRILSLADALGHPAADVAEMVSKCPALLDVLPLRLRGAVEALASALGLSQPQALYMLASDINLLDTPPLRVRQYLESLSQLLGVPLQLAVALAWQCPRLLCVEAAAVQVRWNSLQAVLNLNHAALQQLLAKDPRLLMPDSRTLAANHAAILTTLNISPTTLNRWVAAAPMLLLVPATQLQQRLDKLSAVMAQEGAQLLAAAGGGDAAAAAGAATAASHNKPMSGQGSTSHELDSSSGSGSECSSSSNGSGSGGSGSSNGSGSDGSSHSSSIAWCCTARDPLQLLAYVSKDPRVLLLGVRELPQRVWQVSKELGCGVEAAAWLVLQHPSYLAMESGLASGWMDDVRHVADVTLLHAKRLAACPQVFLTMSPEDVLANLSALRETLNLSTHGQTLDYTPASVAAIAASEPLLLVQHPAATAAAVQQLQVLVQDQPLRQQMVYSAPQVLMQGGQLRQVFAAAAGVLSITCAQLAVMLVNDPGLWSLMVPRHTWPCCPLAQQQQQHGPGVGPAAPPPPPGPAAGAAGTAAAAEVRLSSAAAAAAATMSALLHCGLRPPEVMQAAVVLHPALLRLDAEAALLHVQTLQACVARCSAWQQQLQHSLSPDQVGRAVVRALVWEDRWLFLIQYGWASSIEFGELMGMRSKDFLVNFREQYMQWQAQQRQRQQQAGGNWPQQLQQRQPQQPLQGLHQQQGRQPPELQLQEAPAAAFDGLVDALAAKFSGREPVAAAGAAPGWSATPAAQPSPYQQHWGGGGSASQGEVYYDGVLATESSSSSTGGGGSSRQQDGWDHPQPQQQQKQQQGQHAWDTQAAGRGKWLGNPLRWSVNRFEQMAAAVQLSGLELYGTWLGCLMQPLDTVPAAGGGGGGLSSAAAVGGDLSVARRGGAADSAEPTASR